MDFQSQVNVIKKSVINSHGLTFIYKGNEKSRSVLATALTVTGSDKIILGAWDLNAQGFRSYSLDAIEDIAINNSLNATLKSENYITDQVRTAITSFSIDSKPTSSITEVEKRELLSENIAISKNISIIESTINSNVDNPLIETCKILTFEYLSKSGKLNVVQDFLPSCVTYSEKTKKLITTGTVKATDESTSSIRSYNIENMNNLLVQDCKRENIFDAIENYAHDTSSSTKTIQPSKINKKILLGWIGTVSFIILGISNLLTNGLG